jgi:hypothetical protein
MTIDIIIKPSHLSSKKYDAIIDGKKTIPFGQKGASDMTQHKDEARKNLYIAPHQKSTGKIIILIIQNNLKTTQEYNL